MSTNTAPGWIPPETLSEIYGAAVSTGIWPAILDRCCTHVGSRSASMTTFDIQDPTSYSLNALSSIYREADQSLIAYFAEHLAPLDASAHDYSLQLSTRQIYRDTDVWPDVSSLDNREDSVWLRKHFGVRRRIAMRLNDNPRYFDNIAFQFPNAVLNPPAEAFSKAHALAPHLAKSLEMSILYSRLQTHYAAVLSALDKVGVGMCIVEANGSITFANTEALRIIENDQGLKKTTAGKLTCHNDDNANQLKSMILAASLVQKNNVPRAESILATRRYNSDEPLLIEVSPLRDHNDELNTGHDTVLLQIVDTDCSKHCDTSAFSIAYQLSNAESAIVPLLLSGLTNGEIADERSTSLNTVKSQVTTLMRKTQVDSRVQLVRRILKTEPPVQYKK